MVDQVEVSRGREGGRRGREMRGEREGDERRDGGRMREGEEKER